MAHGMKFGLSALLVSFIAACSSGETTGTTGNSSTPSTPTPVGPSTPLDPTSIETPLVVADQFGYLPDADKILLARQSRTGFDATAFPAIAASYDIYSEAEGRVVLTITPSSWNNGQVDPRSGDIISTLDASAITTPGSYFVTESGEQTSLATFEIQENIYAPVFKAAFRTFYYQRSGFEKAAPYAASKFLDGASHLGTGQDSEARRFLQKQNATLQRDLRGGWYDAGDLNKYTNWTADYCLMLLASFEENPGAWGDLNDLPESHNGIPDLLDEVRWGMDWLLRMQSGDGSVLSLVGSESATPPSSASAPSFYGDASTSATLSSAAAFAYGAVIYRQQGDTAYADELENAALAAWNWAEANPNVIFQNNDPASQTEGLGAGKQEVDEKSRAIKRHTAAARIFELTGDAAIGTIVEDMLSDSPLVIEQMLSPYHLPHLDALRGFAKHPNASATARNTITNLVSSKRIQASAILRDAYRSPVDNFHWGSNATKASRALTYLVANEDGEANQAASGYVHYMHGVNPMGVVYLSEMAAAGAETSVKQLYHAGFENGAPPGFVTGGPNPTYNWAACCPNSCGGGNSCNSERLSPPAGQPDMKSYLDFNENWTLSPWQVNENSNGYQVAYLRMLAFYVE